MSTGTNEQNIMRAKKKKKLIIGLVAFFIFGATLVSMCCFIGARGTYVNVSDPNDFYSFTVLQYEHRERVDREDISAHGIWTRKDDKIIFKDKDKNNRTVNYSRGDFDQIYINNVEYRRVSIIFYNDIVQRNKVVFDFNGADIPNYVDHSKIGKKVSAPAAPERENYIFRGWYTEPYGYKNYTGIKFNDNDRVWDNMTFYANWESNVKYAVSGSEDALLQACEGDLLLAKLLAAESTGYTYNYEMRSKFKNGKFGEWYAVTDKTVMPPNDVEVRTSGDGIPRPIKITLDLNGGNFDAADNVPTIYNSKYLESFILTAKTPVLEGYKFGGWILDETKYSAGNKYILQKTTDVTFTAEWIEIGQVTYLNGSEDAEGVMQTATAAAVGDIISLPNCDYKLDGHSFIGWSDEVKLYRTGALYAVTAERPTFTAKWVNDSDTYTVIDAKGDKSSTGKYLVYGSYPQSIKPKHVTIVSERGVNENGEKTFVGSDGATYIKNTASFEADGQGAQRRFTNGDRIGINQTYFFKVEPIIWKIGERDPDGSAFLISETIIDVQLFNESSSLNEVSVYPSNWENSFLRGWLKKYFVPEAFNAQQQDVINVETLVDNSITAFAGPTGGGNIYAKDQNPTEDKVFLLSYMVAWQYSAVGFDKDDNNTRRRMTTDYARSKNVVLKLDGEDRFRHGEGIWWTRSASHNNPNAVSFIDKDSRPIPGGNPVNATLGIVPAMRINIT